MNLCFFYLREFFVFLQEGGERERVRYEREQQHHWRKNRSIIEQHTPSISSCLLLYFYKFFKYILDNSISGGKIDPL